MLTWAEIRLKADKRNESERPSIRCHLSFSPTQTKARNCMRSVLGENSAHSLVPVVDVATETLSARVDGKP